MSTFEKCITKVTESLKGKLSERDVREVIEQIEERVFNKNLQNQDLLPELIEQEALKLSDEIARAKLMERRRKALSAKARVQRRQRIESHLNNGLTPDKALTATTVGAISNIRNGKFSVDALAKANEARYLGGLISDLEKHDLTKLAVKGKMDAEITRELMQVNDPNGTPGITGNNEALQIAKILSKYQKKAVKELNARGADIGDLNGYITRQTHSQQKVAYLPFLQNAVKRNRRPFEDWYNDIIDLLDHDKTFAGQDPVAFLKSAHRNIINGEHVNYSGAETDQISYNLGSLAKNISKQRVLHFKDADAWMTYNNKYGLYDNTIESVVAALRKAAQQEALMKVYGPSPEAAYEADVKWLRDKFKDDPDNFARIASGSIRNRFNEAYFRQVSGQLDFTQSPRLGSTASVIRAWQAMTKLGGAGLSSIADVVFRASAARLEARPFLSEFGDGLVSMFRGRGNKETRILASSLGAGFDGLVGKMASRFSAEDTIPGAVAKGQALFFRLNLLSHMTDGQRTGYMLGLSNNLAIQSKGPWSDVTDDMKILLEQFEIGEKEWPLIQKLRHGLEEDDREFISIDMMDQITDEDLRVYLGKTEASPRELTGARTDIEQKVQSFFSERVSHAVIQPEGRERTILKGNKQAGTVTGEFYRFFWQFKGFPLAVLTKAVAPHIARQGRPDIMGLVHLAVLSSVFGYISMSAKGILRGEKPRPLDNPRTLGAAMVQGGGAGIMGDFFFGDYNRFGNDFSTTLAGPTLGGTINTTAELFAAVRDGDPEAAKFFDATISAIPGSNLFYVRSVLNYLMLYDIQESLNPGYLKRLEQRKQREQGVEYFLPPSKVVK